MQPGGSLPCSQQPDTCLPGATRILSMLSTCNTYFNSFPSTRCPSRQFLSLRCPNIFFSTHAACHPILVFIDSWPQVLIMNLMQFHGASYSLHVRAYILIFTLFSKTLSLFSSSNASDKAPHAHKEYASRWNLNRGLSFVFYKFSINSEAISVI
jgi:hypothetical protein